MTVFNTNGQIIGNGKHRSDSEAVTIPSPPPGTFASKSSMRVTESKPEHIIELVVRKQHEVPHIDNIYIPKVPLECEGQTRLFGRKARSLIDLYHQPLDRWATLICKQAWINPSLS